MIEEGSSIKDVMLLEGGGAVDSSIAKSIFVLDSFNLYL